MRSVFCLLHLARHLGRSCHDGHGFWRGALSQLAVHPVQLCEHHGLCGLGVRCIVQRESPFRKGNTPARLIRNAVAGLLGMTRCSTRSCSATCLLWSARRLEGFGVSLCGRPMGFGMSRCGRMVWSAQQFWAVTVGSTPRFWVLVCSAQGFPGLGSEHARKKA